MYSVLLMAAFTAAPEQPAGLIFHRRKAGCTGTTQQAYALVPVRSQGCTGGFAAAPQGSCVGQQYAGATIYAAPLPQTTLVYVPRTPVRRLIGYRTVCYGDHCEQVAIYE